MQKVVKSRRVSVEYTREREKVRSTFLGRQEGQCSAITMRSRLAKPIGTRMCSAEYYGKEFVVVDKVSQNTVSLYAVCQ